MSTGAFCAVASTHEAAGASPCQIYDQLSWLQELRSCKFDSSCKI